MTQPTSVGVVRLLCVAIWHSTLLMLLMLWQLYFNH